MVERGSREGYERNDGGSKASRGGKAIRKMLICKNGDEV